MAVEKIQVPDLGTDDAVEVIEVLVKPGDSINENDSLVVLESDKAAMEIPASVGGIVKEVLVKVGAQVKTGADLVVVETAGTAEAPATEEKSAVPAETATPAAEPEAAESESAESPAAGGASVQAIEVPDLGGTDDVDVIDILVKVGDTVEKEDGLVTLETDKAAMEVPAPTAGRIVAIKVKVGDKVKQGSVIVDLETTEAPAPSRKETAAPIPSASTSSPAPAAAKPAAAAAQATGSTAEAVNYTSGEVYAGPAVRKLARELGVDLAKVSGSGNKGRIIKEDVQAWVKNILQGSGAAAGGGAGLPPVEDIDFSKFGEIEEVEMTKLHRVTAQNMTKCWLNVPHVTQFDEADITDLEDFRNAQKKLAEKKGIKLTPLPFIVLAEIGRAHV